ncbi:hypothetical protein LG293_17790 (plasmid) [Citricoccus nitrophenolicus]
MPTDRHHLTVGGCAVLFMNVIGACASIIAFVLWLPQAKRTWTVRNDPQAMAGISAGTNWLLAINAVNWSIYAVLAEAWWSGVPALVNFPLAVGTLMLIYRSRRIVARTGMSRAPIQAPALEAISAP